MFLQQRDRMRPERNRPPRLLRLRLLSLPPIIIRYGSSTSFKSFVKSSPAIIAGASRTGKGYQDFEAGPQDVHEYDPVDYFRRIVAEDLAPGELRDQTVLRDIDDWKAGKPDALMTGLVNATEEDDTYSRRWEHFAARQSTEQVVGLARQVADRVLERDRRSAVADQAGLISIWRAVRTRAFIPETAAWVEEQAVQAVFDAAPL